MAEIQSGTPRVRTRAGIALFLFAVPSLFFPIAYIPWALADMRWYNEFRSINRIELFSALIAPAAGYATFMKAGLPYRGYGGGASPVMRIIKPLAFPFCVLLISVNFIGPLIMPLDREITYDDYWADGGVYIQSVRSTSGPAALLSAMYSINNFADSELAAATGTYTSRAGAEFWYLARYAVNRGYKAAFVDVQFMDDIPVPALIPVTRIRPDGGGTGGAANDGGEDGAAINGDTGGAARRSAAGGEYVALLGHTDGGLLVIGDPETGRHEIPADDFTSRYGTPALALALYASKSK